MSLPAITLSFPPAALARARLVYPPAVPPISLAYPLPTLAAMRLRIPNEFLPVPVEISPLQTSEGEDFQFDDGTTREVNPG